VEPDGRLAYVGAAGDDVSIETALEPFVSGDCLVAFDAPLIVNNPTGQRPAESAYNRDFRSFDAGAHPANTGKPEFANGSRAARLAAALTLDIDPASTSNRRAVEVYPHPATVVLFGLDKILKYKRGAFDDRKRELLTLMTHIEELDGATPRLRVNRSVAWVELRKRVEAATRPSQLDHDEDPVDAVVCAYIALYWYDRPEDVTIYGDLATGYIVTPTLPPDRMPQARPQPKNNDKTRQRLARATALLAEAQAELAALRDDLER